MYVIDARDSKVFFRMKHMGISMIGEFRKFSGRLTINSQILQAPGTSVVGIFEVDASSLKSGLGWYADRLAIATIMADKKNPKFTCQLLPEVGGIAAIDDATQRVGLVTINARTQEQTFKMQIDRAFLPGHERLKVKVSAVMKPSDFDLRFPSGVLGNAIHLEADLMASLCHQLI
mmetsp:Transcript_84013/g.148577  ORF Transcript_84013/g.148577 Transcript_84013/m.148577 type:complete len:175 (-) Transcript_84013:78-602(-)